MRCFGLILAGLAALLMLTDALGNGSVYARFTAPGEVVTPDDSGYVRFSAEARRDSGIGRVVIVLPDGARSWVYRAPYPAQVSFPKVVWNTAGYPVGVYSASIQAFAPGSRVPFGSQQWVGTLQR